MKWFPGICAVVASIAVASGGAAACEIYDSIEFQTDFAFHLAGKTFPPGAYSVERTDLQYGQPLRIASAGSGGGYDFSTADVEATELPTADNVVFELVDGKQMLTEIWMADKMVGCKVIDEAEHKAKEKKSVEGKRKKHSSKAN